MKRSGAFLAGMLMLAAAVPVCGAQNTEEKTTLTADVGSVYTVSIPADQDIVFGKEDTTLDGRLKVTGNVKPGEKVTVSASATAFVNQDVNGESFAFSLKSGAAEFTSMDWSEAELRAAAPKEAALTVHVPSESWAQAKAGTYKASITFRAELK